MLIFFCEVWILLTAVPIFASTVFFIENSGLTKKLLWSESCTLFFFCTILVSELLNFDSSTLLHRALMVYITNEFCHWNWGEFRAFSIAPQVSGRFMPWSLASLTLSCCNGGIIHHFSLIKGWIHFKSKISMGKIFSTLFFGKSSLLWNMLPSVQPRVKSFLLFFAYFWYVRVNLIHWDVRPSFKKKKKATEPYKPIIHHC